MLATSHSYLLVISFNKQCIYHELTHWQVFMYFKNYTTFHNEQLKGCSLHGNGKPNGIDLSCNIPNFCNQVCKKYYTKLKHYKTELVYIFHFNFLVDSTRVHWKYMFII